MTYHVTRLGGGRVVGGGVGCGVGWGWGVGGIFPVKATNFVSDLFRFYLKSPD